MAQEVLSNLEKISFLANQDKEALKLLAAKTKKAKFLKRSFIITEGERSDDLYIVLSGKVRIFRADDNNKEVTLMLQEAGTCFGLLALLSKQARSASAEALEPTECAIISKSDFMRWLDAHPVVALELMSVLTDKIRSLSDTIKDLTLSSAYERTVKTLHKLAIQEGDYLVIHNRPTQEVLANMVGVGRETVAKFLHGLTEGGYLVMEGKSIKIQKKLPARF
jgi:CRP/FNR family cyclic AMP-dependent transcriptional regulator